VDEVDLVGLAVLDSAELGQAKAAYQQALARETLTRETYEREKTAPAEKISSEQEALTARAAHLEAAEELRRAEETLRLMGLSASEMGQAGSSLSPVSSPFDGTVVEKERISGRWSSPTMSSSPSPTSRGSGSGSTSSRRTSGAMIMAPMVAGLGFLPMSP
jgi:multidrug efflux pump subunit AcrA (membrane-fusion protein)